MVTRNSPDSLDPSTPNGFRNLGGIIKGASREEATDLLLQQGLSPDRVETFLGSRGGSNWLRQPASETNAIYPDLPAGVTVLRSGAVLQPQDQRSLESRLEDLPAPPPAPPPDGSGAGDLGAWWTEANQQVNPGAILFTGAEDPRVDPFTAGVPGATDTVTLPNGRVVTWTVDQNSVPQITYDSYQDSAPTPSNAATDAAKLDERRRQVALDAQRWIAARDATLVAPSPSLVGEVGAPGSETDTSLIPLIRDAGLFNTGPGLPRHLSGFRQASDPSWVDPRPGQGPAPLNTYQPSGGEGGGLSNKEIFAILGGGAALGVADAMFRARAARNAASSASGLRGTPPPPGYRGPGAPGSTGSMPPGTGAYRSRPGGSGSRGVPAGGTGAYRSAYRGPGPGGTPAGGIGAYRSAYKGPGTGARPVGGVPVSANWWRGHAGLPASSVRQPSISAFRVPHAVAARSMSTFVPAPPFGIQSGRK